VSTPDVHGTLANEVTYINGSIAVFELYNGLACAYHEHFDSRRFQKRGCLA